MSKVKDYRDIVILTHNDAKGGAARAALRWLSCFLANGVQSELLVAKKFTSNESVIQLGFLKRNLCSLLSRLDIIICKIIEPASEGWNSSGYFGSISARSINKDNFSILNIHWIGHGLISLRQLGKIKKPIVWTLHDEWILNPFSHYPINAPYKRISIQSLLRNNRLQVKTELALKENFYFVCLTESLATKLRTKFPSKVDKIFVIPNPVDLSVFYPDQVNLNFPIIKVTEPYLLFLGGISDSRKGWDLLKESIKITKSSYTLIVIGNLSDSDLVLNKKVKIIAIQEITDKNLLRMFYSNAKAVLVPSRAEQLPQVATESISCGTPIIAYDVDGLKDIVIHQKTGWLIPAFDIKNFSLAIDSLVSKDSSDMELNCRTFAEKNFSYEEIANKFKIVMDLIKISY
jgi:glycosyltransferase involved in cell wall biosynthesis